MSPLSVQTLLKIVPNSKKTISNQVLGDCPSCGKSGHFYVNTGYNYRGILHGYDCKKCHISGGVYTLLLLLDRKDLLEGETIKRDKLNKLEFFNEIEEIEEDFETPVKKLPIGCKAIIGNKYLDNRKFTDLDYELYKPQKTEFFKRFKDYIIIPIMEDYLIKGYVGRYIGTNPIAPRYNNSLFTPFGKLLFGIDELTNKTDTVILTEGIFDKISVTAGLGLHNNDTVKCLCTFGKKISNIQIGKLLKQKELKNVLLMYDGTDAINDMKKIGFVLNKYFHVRVCDTGKKDPGEMDKWEIEDCIGESKVPDEFFFKKIQKYSFI